MGKNLKGRECGKGICQRKDGKYFARYCARDGKRQGMYFDTLPEARNWLADAIYEEKHGIVVTNTDMTVDEWFKFWTENLICDLFFSVWQNNLCKYYSKIQLNRIK